MRVFLLLTVVLLFFTNCSGTAGKEKNLKDERISLPEAILPDAAKTAHLSGKDLANAYCQACHALPAPGLLDKATWQNKVLPQMGLRLGLPAPNINPFLDKQPDEIYALIKAGIYPQKPLIAAQDWQKIVAYYTQAAPEKLTLPALTKLDTTLNNFSVIIPDLNKGKPALTTLIKYETQAKELWVGDLRNWLFRLNHSLKAIDSVHLQAVPVDLIKTSAGYNVVNIGSILPTDKATGNIYQVLATAKEKSTGILLKDLHRPVNIIEADLNQDKLPDLVVCNYGYNFGSLVVYFNLGKGKYEPVTLKNLPGARKAEIKDLNHDGLPDIIALFAQGTETLKVFYNQGNGKFAEENLVQFPPVYGTNYFQLVDFNQDGHLDILFANGDNADYSFMLKPYHGIRIWLNNGKNKFRQKYFFQMPGAWKAVAHDFDQDGDLDIAAISYFPDFERSPERGFIYLEQTAQFNFTAATFKQSQLGHWFTLETADYDQDGDEDIVLGSFTNSLSPVPPGIRQNWLTNGPGILVLQNKKITKQNQVISVSK
ncbi:MAG: FG-GAP-like repeat-containing protein [Adhaeribacter sp.]